MPKLVNFRLVRDHVSKEMGDLIPEYDTQGCPLAYTHTLKG